MKLSVTFEFSACQPFKCLEIMKVFISLVLVLRLSLKKLKYVFYGICLDVYITLGPIHGIFLGGCSMQ